MRDFDKLIDGYRLVGAGVLMQQIRSQIAKIASAEVSVLIPGKPAREKNLSRS